ncbi:MAG: Maf family protein [Chitinophagaceae bacterium]
MKQIILASQSPRRKQLLEWAEIPFEVIVKDTDEQYPAGLSIEEVPVYIARNKATAVKRPFHEKRIILAADTIVVLENQVIGKPRNISHAIEILTALSGCKHSVITGVVILSGDNEIAFSDTTDVYFNALTPEQIAFYVNKFRPMDKAGAYAIQEWIGVVGIQSINGDFYNVMGLPVNRVVQALHILNKQ